MGRQGLRGVERVFVLVRARRDSPGGARFLYNGRTRTEQMKLRRQAGVRMNGMLKAACAAVLLIAATTIEIGCGDTYRPVALPLPTTTGNPSGAETEVVLNQCPSGSGSACTSSVITDINVSGDTNTGNKVLYNTVAGVVEGSVGTSGATVNIPAIPMAFDYSRTSVFTANLPTATAPASVTQILLNTSTAGFAANTNTITMYPNSNPIGVAFEYYGSTYTQDYVVDAPKTTTTGTTTTITATPTCTPYGSLDVIQQASAELKAQACVGATPVAAWIYRDQSKVYVLDKTENQVYVVSASTYQWTSKILLPVGLLGVAPIKAAQSNNGQYVYVLNSGTSANGGSISVIDGTVDQLVSTVSTNISTSSLTTTAQPIDIAQDTNFNDTSANTQINHVWILLADGTVSVYDGTIPGQLTWITSLSTIKAAQAAAGAYPTNLALMRDGTGAYVGVGNTDQIVGINTAVLATGAVTPGVNAAGGFGATTSITVGVHRSISATLSYTYTDTTTGNVATYTTTPPVLLENTVPTVTNVAVSRGGNSADLSKAYATTTTSTTYYCYDYQGNSTDCSNDDAWVSGNTVAAAGTTATPAPSGVSFLVGTCTDLGLFAVNSSTSLYAMSCPNLYNGTAVVTAASGLSDPLSNTYIPINTNVTTIVAPWEGTFVGPVVNTCTPMTDGYDQQKYCPAMVPVMVLGRS
jgi:hypothetical protein